MSFRLGSVNGFKLGGTGISGTSNLFDTFSCDSNLMKHLKKTKSVDLQKRIKVDCGFCKEKIGLLSSDVFQKQVKK